jgi:hypothetical protein
VFWLSRQLPFGMKDWGSRFLRNVRYSPPDYAASLHRIRWFANSPPENLTFRTARSKKRNAKYLLSLWNRFSIIL